MKKPTRSGNTCTAELTIVYFRHPKTQNSHRCRCDETSNEFTSLYNALIGALENERQPPRDPNTRRKRRRDDGTVKFGPPTLGWFIKILKSDYFNPEQ